MINRLVTSLVRVAVVAAFCMSLAQATPAQEQQQITHTLLFKSELPDTAGQEIIVWDTRYAPGALNPRHLHPAAITFQILSGTGVWQEDGKAPITLHAGDSLFVAAGTIHSHWKSKHHGTASLHRIHCGTEGQGPINSAAVEKLG